MLAVLLSTWLACCSVQDPLASAAVAVRGDAELSPAAALASAQTKVAEHVRNVWRERAEGAVATQRPFWLPALITDEAVRRWLADLPLQQMVAVVDREDREREHEFGSSYQTTLWVAEDPQRQQHAERRLRGELKKLERSTLVRFGGVAAGWTFLVVALGWIDRLSRGYMTGRLWLAGLLGGVAVPAIAFLV
ncbi:MAG: hypothetical protein WAT39_11665 [Planctomycetota bacterium]